MFRKCIALLNQTKKILPYRSFLPLRMSVFTVTFMLLLCGITAVAQVPLKIDDHFTHQVLNSVIISNDALVYYSLGVCFFTGTIIFSLAVGSHRRKQRKQQSVEQQRMIEQLQINEKHNEALNTELSALLEDRTIELKKSMALIQKQSEEILVMSAMLKTDIHRPNLDVEQVGKAPVLSKFADFEAFSKVFPDKDSILKYIAGLKWGKGYLCIRCQNATFLVGQTAYSRRCTKCGYDESATVNTSFHNTKIQINKALYMLILVYNTKGTISSYKLAELLNIRQSTCWVYSSRFKKKLPQIKAGPGKADSEGWSQMVLDAPI